MIAGMVAATFYQGAVGGWMGSLIDKEHDSQLGMWFAIANTGASGLMILLAGGVVRSFPPIVGACVVAGGMMLPMLLFLVVPAPGPDRRLASESFGRFWAEVASFAQKARSAHRSHPFSASLRLVCTHQRPGRRGKDFAASEHLVSMFAGVGTVAAGLAGSFLLQPLARRFALRPSTWGLESPADYSR